MIYKKTIIKIIKSLMKKFYISILIVIFLFFQDITSSKVDAITYDWSEVPSSEYGSQVWDKLSFQRNNDGSIRVLSKFIPKTKNDITNDILYTMDINCAEKTFRDVALGQDKFNEFKNPNTDWKEPDGDFLILGVIDQVCNYKN